VPALRGRPDRRLPGDFALHPGAGEHLRDLGGRDPSRARAAARRAVEVRAPAPAAAQHGPDDRLLAVADPGREPGGRARGRARPRLRRVPRPAPAHGGPGGRGRLHAVRDPVLLRRATDPGPRHDRGIRRPHLSGSPAAAALRGERGPVTPARSRWVVFAYHTFGARALAALLARGETVALVVTHEDQPAEGDWFESVADVARAHGVPVLTPPSPNDPALVARLAALDADVFLSVWYRRVLGDA